MEFGGLLYVVVDDDLYPPSPNIQFNTKNSYV